MRAPAFMKRLPLNTIFALVLKSGKLLKVLKLLKFTKLLVTFLSMAVSTLVYSFLLGPWFAVGFVIMLFIHEMGHVIAMKQKGYPVSAPVFIPMLGAVIFAPPFNSKHDEAYIGYGGPLLGSLAALIAFGVWALWPGRPPILLLVSYSAAFLNLFNLLPIRPLDGGRITQIVGDWFKWFGLVGLIVMSWFIKQPAILLIWILVLADLKLHPWFRFWAGVSCQGVMTALMLTGHSHQPGWVDGLDIGLATLFNAGFYSVAKRTTTEPLEEPSVPTPVPQRLKWLGLYCLILVGLIALMAAQMPYLPARPGR